MVTKYHRSADRAWCERMGERNERAARMRKRPFWKRDAFWFVLLPTAFALGMIGIAFVMRMI
jgi:hypothetical protein